MNKILSLVGINILLMLLFIQMAFSQDYVLSPGDVLSITIYGHEELQVKGLTVGTNGKIAFPLLGEVDAVGLSLVQLTEKITVSLSEYVQNPIALVNIEKYRTTRVYVLGEVPKPGLYELEKQHNLLDAIGMAGGYTKSAAKKKVFIIHKDKPEQPVKVNLLNLLERADMTQNVALSDGDVVYLTRNHKLLFPQDLLLYVNIWDQLDD